MSFWVSASRVEITTEKVMNFISKGQTFVNSTINNFRGLNWSKGIEIGNVGLAKRLNGMA